MCQRRIPFAAPAVAVLAILLLGCETDSGAADAGQSATLAFPLDAPTRYTEVRDCRTSIDHGLTQIAVFAGPSSAADAYTAGQYPLPEGTVLVKAIYEGDQECNTITGFAAMRKEAPGTFPDGGDWTWQETDAEGNVLSENSLRCTSCHKSCSDRDWTCTEP